MLDHFRLARQGAKALAAIGGDAARSLFGRGLPLSPAALTRPTTFERLLRGRARGLDELPLRPSAIVPTGVVAPSSNCQNTVFEMTWENDPGDEAAPATLFVKQPCADFPTRLFANVIGFWEIECAFCENVSPRVPIAMPRIHAVVQRRSRFIIVMENLAERPDTRLFVNRDLLEGVELPMAERCLQTLARLHAGLAGVAPNERERLLPHELHPFLSPSRRPVNAVVNRLAVERCHQRAPETFGRADVEVYRRALDHWEALSSVWYREPLTLVHGDSHLGNFFETGDEMGMIDFQGAHWGNGIRDVQYFLINSMPPERLAEHEQELIAGYCEERTRLGARLTTEEGFDQYRGLSFQTLMTAVVSLGLGSFTDSDEVMQMMLDRAVAATHRLDFGAWLDALIAEAAEPTD